MATKFWRRPSVRRARRLTLAAVGFGAAIYFVPAIALLYIVCGLIDVGRHKRITGELLEKYFLGNGIGTWLISPVNLLADLLSHRNIGVFRLEDLPAEHRREIETCVRAFIENGDRIKAHIDVP